MSKRTTPRNYNATQLGIRREQCSKPNRPGPSPNPSFSLDLISEEGDIGSRIVEGRRIAMLPNPPGRKHDDRRSALSSRGRGGVDRCLPPIGERDANGRWGTRRSNPREGAGEGTIDQEMIYGLQGLIAQQVSWGVSQTMACSSLSGPAAVLAS